MLVETLLLWLSADLPDLDVRMVASALEALRLVETIPLAALVTDLHMPRMDGFELIERIRAQPQFATMPIFVISGDSDVDTPSRVCGDLGADAFFAKPFSPHEVRQALERFLYTR